MQLPDMGGSPMGEANLFGRMDLKGFELRGDAYLNIGPFQMDAHLEFIFSMKKGEEQLHLEFGGFVQVQSPSHLPAFHTLL